MQRSLARRAAARQQHIGNRGTLDPRRNRQRVCVARAGWVAAVGVQLGADGLVLADDIDAAALLFVIDATRITARCVRVRACACVRVRA